MPCYEVRTYSVEFKAANRAIFDAAIGVLKWKPDWEVSDRLSFDGGKIVIDLNKGTATVQDDAAGTVQGRLNELKRAYSRQSIVSAAKKRGWQIGSTPGVENKGRLMKRVG